MYSKKAAAEKSNLLQLFTINLWEISSHVRDNGEKKGRLLFRINAHRIVKDAKIP